LLRDLQLIDHQRRVAAGQGESNVFRFLSNQDNGPDFESQRRISPAVDRTLQAGYRALSQGARLLLTGESGSGKTEMARYLHKFAGTAEEPFVHVNCGAIPDSLFESEMFGYEKGAFTDALRTGKQGLIESAEGGTLFLDEVGEIPLTSQAKLLKFLEDGVVQRVGGRTGRRLRMRVVSATNRNLWKLVEQKQFRNDLYYRLAVINLEVMPLREQPELVRHLIAHFLKMTNRMRHTPLVLSDECYDCLIIMAIFVSCIISFNTSQ
jgi:transcriptional regulator with PAS, ATPase and Fis domain